MNDLQDFDKLIEQSGLSELQAAFVRRIAETEPRSAMALLILAGKSKLDLLGYDAAAAAKAAAAAADGTNDADQA